MSTPPPKNTLATLFSNKPFYWFARKAEIFLSLQMYSHWLGFDDYILRELSPTARRAHGVIALSSLISISCLSLGVSSFIDLALREPLIDLMVWLFFFVLFFILFRITYSSEGYVLSQAKTQKWKPTVVFPILIMSIGLFTSFFSSVFLLSRDKKMFRLDEKLDFVVYNMPILSFAIVAGLCILTALPFVFRSAFHTQREQYLEVLWNKSRVIIVRESQEGLKSTEQELQKYSSFSQMYFPFADYPYNQRPLIMGRLDPRDQVQESRDDI